MKKTILRNLEKYVEKDERALQMLQELRAAGRNTFLLTNSDYPYTNGIMTYLLGRDWLSHFDIVVVDARKPLFFGEGTVFREVNTETGALKIGIHTGPLRKGSVYSGGRKLRAIGIGFRRKLSFLSWEQKFKPLNQK